MDPLKLLTRGTNLRVKEMTASHAAAQDVSACTRAITATGGTPAPHLGKRKRDDRERESQNDSRSILKRHKIKVTDLGALQKARAESRNVQKDHFRLYPTPVTSFEQLRARFRVRPSLAQNLADQGYVEPTEVQMAALPLLTEEPLPNLLTVAPTGSGKTVAFMVPLIHGISQLRHKSASTGTRHNVTALVLAPTKELVGQIVNEGRKLVARTGVSISAVRKGMRIAGSSTAEQTASKTAEINEEEDQEQNEDTGPAEVKSDILVSTPLALLHAISAGAETQSPTLPHIRHLIFDEADVLLDQLFRVQTLAVWRACTNMHLQVSLWSATMGSHIEELATTTIRDHQERSSEQRPLLRCVIGLKDSAVSTISHQMIYAGTEPGKLLGLRDLLHPPPAPAGKKRLSLLPPFLVFTQTIERAKALHSELLYDIPAEAGGLERVAVLHSDLSDTKRADVMTQFRNGRIWVLITTDLLSRGVDFRGVNGVVNYDIPTTTAAYVHRAGRTGRAGRQGGIAVTLFTNDDINYVKGIANVIVASEKAKGGSLDTVEGVESWMLNALPDVSKQDKKELKQRGVQSRRSIREGDDKKAMKAKRKAKISTKSGYEIRREKNQQGAIEASKRRREDDSEGSEWSGLG